MPLYGTEEATVEGSDLCVVCGDKQNIMMLLSVANWINWGSNWSCVHQVRGEVVVVEQC